MPFCWLTTTDDLARWEPCGIPSAWRSPTARRPGGSPRRDRRQSSGSSVPGSSCGSPGGRSAGCHTLSTLPQPRPHWWLAILEVCPPGEGMFWLGRAAFGDVAPLRQR